MDYVISLKNSNSHNSVTSKILREMEISEIRFKGRSVQLLSSTNRDSQVILTMTCIIIVVFLTNALNGIDVISLQDSEIRKDHEIQKDRSHIRIQLLVGVLRDYEVNDVDGDGYPYLIEDLSKDVVYFIINVNVDNPNVVDIDVKETGFIIITSDGELLFVKNQRATITVRKIFEKIINTGLNDYLIH